MSIAEFTELIELGVLGLFTFLLATGRVMPASTVEKILEESRKHVRLVVDEIRKDIKQSVRDGMMEAFYDYEHNGPSKPDDAS